MFMGIFFVAKWMGSIVYCTLSLIIESNESQNRTAAKMESYFIIAGVIFLIIILYIFIARRFKQETELAGDPNMKYETSESDSNSNPSTNLSFHIHEEMGKQLIETLRRAGMMERSEQEVSPGQTNSGQPSEEVTSM